MDYARASQSHPKLPRADKSHPRITQSQPEPGQSQWKFNIKGVLREKLNSYLFSLIPNSQLLLNFLSFWYWIIASSRLTYRASGRLWLALVGSGIIHRLVLLLVNCFCGNLRTCFPVPLKTMNYFWNEWNQKKTNFMISKKSISFESEVFFFFAI